MNPNDCNHITKIFPDEKSPILVSACLLGIDCTYKASNNENQLIIDLQNSRRLIPVCPEQLGGLSTPREPQNILSGTGKDVLNGATEVINKKGFNVTANFIQGAEETLKIAKILKVKYAIMKERSPSCGVKRIFNDKLMNNRLVDGMGVTTALLQNHGLQVISEKEFEDLK